MKNILFIFLLFLIVSCHQSSTHHSSASAKSDEGSRIQVSWFVGLPVIDVNATAQVIGRGYNWTEGPVWIAGRQTLIFSDVPENKIFQWKEGDSAKVYLMPSGYTGTLPRGGEIGSNGLALDNKGRLLLCQSGNRQVARMEGSLASPVPKYTSLAGRYKGRKFNSPNDLITDSKGNIYFTDPIYGLPKGANDPERELKFEGVYKIDILILYPGQTGSPFRLLKIYCIWLAAMKTALAGMLIILTKIEISFSEEYCLMPRCSGKQQQ